MRYRRRELVIAAVAACGLAAGVVAAPAQAVPMPGGAAERGGPLAREFAAAAAESGVPEPILLAVSYDLTRWDGHAGQRSADGGYGLLDVPGPPEPSGDPAEDKGAGPAHPAPPAHPRNRPELAIRTGADLLARYARQGRGALPATIADWYPAVARYANVPSASGGRAFADDVFDTLRGGVTDTAPDGETLTIPANPALRTPDQHRVGGPQPECPPGLDCRFVPAAYDWASADHSDPNNYGDYDPADRPRDGNQIRYIVVHDTEGVPGGVSPYDQAIRTFQNPASFASAHYVIRSRDGQVTQMVPTKDVAWHAGNWSVNAQSIGIEHEGYAAQGGTWYTERMYRASAALVRYLAARYGIPLDREHIIGHEDIPRDAAGPHFADAHWDPGPYWDWAHYFDLLGAPIGGSGQDGGVVTIRPDYATNQPPLTDCSTSPCRPLPPHGANFVYLRTAPRADAPLLTDPVLHPDGSPGTTNISDWSDKAVAGRSYAVAGRSGEWLAIWYGGQRAWLDNPGGRVAVPGTGTVVTPKPGAASIPLYGRAFPDAQAYPPSIPFDPSWQIAPVPWNVPSGQSYVVVGESVGGNYFARFDPANVPSNHTLVQGPPVYLLLSYNHRYVYAQASDVDAH